MVERLKRVKGTIDIINENNKDLHKLSDALQLNPGVNINEQGNKIKGPKFNNKNKFTLQDYFSQKDKDLITKLAIWRIKNNNQRKVQKSEMKTNESEDKEEEEEIWEIEVKILV